MDRDYVVKLGFIALDTEEHAVYVKSNDRDRPGYCQHRRGFLGYHEVNVGYGGYCCVLALIQANGEFISSNDLQRHGKGFTTKSGDYYLYNKLRQEFERQRKGSANWFVRENRPRRYALKIPS